MTGAVGYFICVIFMYDTATYYALYGSIINLVFLTVERYLKVVHPFWSKKKLKRCTPTLKSLCIASSKSDLGPKIKKKMATGTSLRQLVGCLSSEGNIGYPWSSGKFLEQEEPETLDDLHGDGVCMGRQYGVRHSVSARDDASRVRILHVSRCFKRAVTGLRELQLGHCSTTIFHI